LPGRLEFLKKSIAEASLQAVDESQPFVVECDASGVAGVGRTQPRWAASGDSRMKKVGGHCGPRKK